MELKRDEIIKALECCGAYSHGHPCNECPYMHIELADNEICSNRMALDALALIRELTQANEQLSESYDHLEKTKDELIAERSRLTEENERLRQNNLVFAQGVEKVAANYYNLGCADTVRKMQERLTTFFAADDTLKHIEVDAEYINSRIDLIAKELEGI